MGIERVGRVLCVEMVKLGKFYVIVTGYRSKQAIENGEWSRPIHMHVF